LRQPVALITYPGLEVDYTRTTEFRHITGQDHTGTSISWEYPGAEDEPAYPVPCPESDELYRKYARLSSADDIVFVGRLAEYRYYNMDQVVGAALTAAKKITG
jgi:UDP-galactopyranose mutase